MGVAHSVVAVTPDDPNYEVGSTEWNAAHKGAFPAVNVDTDYAGNVQNAVDAVANANSGKGGTVFLTPGTTYTMANLTMSGQKYSDIALVSGFGAARWSSAIIQFTGSGAGIQINGDDDTTLGLTARGIRAHGIKFDGTGSSGITNVLSIKSAQDIRFYDCWFRGGSNSGTYLLRPGATGNTFQLTFYDCYWTNNTAYDVQCDDTGANSQINGLHFYGGHMSSSASTANMRLYATDFIVDGTEFDSGTTGVQVVGCLGGSIRGHLEQHTTRDIVFDLSSAGTAAVGVSISGSRFYPGTGCKNSIHINHNACTGINIGPNSWAAYSSMTANDGLITAVTGTKDCVLSGNIAAGLGSGVLYGTGTGIGSITAGFPVSNTVLGPLT